MSTEIDGYSAPLDLDEQDRRRRTSRRIRALVVAADYRLKVRARHPDGGDSTVEDLIAAEKSQRFHIEHEMSRGSKKHQRMPGWIRWIPRFVLLFDFALLLYFFAGVTDVDWVNPISTALSFAIALSAMVASLSYGLFAFTGHRLRGFKNHSGTVHLDELDGFTKMTCTVAAAVVLVIAVLMFLRMHTEVIEALGGGSALTPTVIATAIATVSAGANFLVIAIQALDGSIEVHRLEKLSSAIRRPYAKAQGMREEAARQADDDRWAATTAAREPE